MESALPDPLRDFTRRGFIRTLLVGTTASMVVGKPWSGGWVASVQASPGVGDAGQLRLKTADFPPLQADFGSVRLGFTGTTQAGPMRPILLTRDGGQYHAVSAECTHQGCLLTAFPASRVTTCSCHGSRFMPTGDVVRGPATSPLESYFVQELEPGVLTIELPEFPSFAVTVEGVIAPGAGRVAVGFNALRNVQYEVQASASAAGPWQVRPFATTPDGAANKSVFTGAGADAKLYVEQGGGASFFAVAAKIRAV